MCRNGNKRPNSWGRAWVEECSLTVSLSLTCFVTSSSIAVIPVENQCNLSKSYEVLRCVSPYWELIFSCWKSNMSKFYEVLGLIRNSIWELIDYLFFDHGNESCPLRDFYSQWSSPADRIIKRVHQLRHLLLSDLFTTRQCQIVYCVPLWNGPIIWHYEDDLSVLYYAATLISLKKREKKCVAPSDAYQASKVIEKIRHFVQFTS